MTKNPTLLSILALTLAACGSSSAPAPATTSAGKPTTAASGSAPALVARAAELDFRPCAPPMPDGCEIAVLEGNPAAEGPFTVRMRSSTPLLVPPHRHPAASRVTVLEGTLNVGFQETVDRSASVAFVTGDYYVNVGGTPHFVWTDAPVVLQLSGTGPWAAVPVGDHAH